MADKTQKRLGPDSSVSIPMTNSQPEENHSLLHDVVDRGNIKNLSKHLNGVNNNNEINQSELQILLYQKCEEGHTEFVKDIFNRKEIDPFTIIKSEQEQYPFLVTSRNGYYEILGLFLKKFEDQNKLGEGLQLSNVWGNTVFHILIKGIIKNLSSENDKIHCKVNHRKCLDIVIKYTKKIQDQIIQVEDFPLICDASEEGLLDVIKFLLNQKCDPTKYHRNGKFPIHIAAHNGYYKILELLIDRLGLITESIINLTDTWGNTAIHNVVLGRDKVLRDQRKITYNQDEIQCSRDRPADSFITREDSNNIEIDHNKCMDILLGNFLKLSNINAVNSKGNTALHLAVKLHSDLTLAKKLLEKGAQNDIINNKGRIAIVPNIIETYKDDKKINIAVKDELISPYLKNKENHEIFLEAVSEGKLQDVENLLENKKIDLADYVNSENETPITITFKNGYDQIANCLVKNIIENKVTITKQLVKKLLDGVIQGCIEYKENTQKSNGKKKEKRLSAYMNCLKLLLEKKTSFNVDIDVQKIARDACQSGLSELITVLLKNGVDPCTDVTIMKTNPFFISFKKGYYDIAGIFMKRLSEENKTHEWFTKLLEIFVDGELELNKLKNNTRQKNNNDLVNYGKCLKNVLKYGDISKLTDDLLYKIYDNNMTDLAKILLDHGSDPTYEFISKEENKPILLVSRHGNHAVLEKLLEKCEKRNTLRKDLSKPNKWGNTSLINAVKGYKGSGLQRSNKNNDIDHLKCVEILMRYRSYFSIDAKTASGNTAIHYALQIHNDTNFVKILIKNGALINVENNRGRTPMSDIRYPLLRAVLDDSMRGNDDDDDMAITMDLSMLSHNQSLDNKTETDLVKAIFSKNSYRHLMLHPIIITFLYMKWKKLENFWILNLVFSWLFLILTMTYVISLQFFSPSDQLIYETILKCLISLFGCVAAIREVIEIYIIRFRYLHIFKNYLEVCVLIMTGIILYFPDSKVQQNCSAWLVIGIVTQAILLVGKAPGSEMPMYIRMFKTVMYNFVKVSIYLYFWLILSFSFGFLIISKDTSEPDISLTFMNYLKLIMGTIVMSTGEMDYSDLSTGENKSLLSFDMFPISSHLLFFVFVFIVVFVIMNLINGIAISDIHMIRKKAECHGIWEQAEYVIEIEEIMKIILKLFSRYEVENKFWNKFLVFDSCYPQKEVTFYPKRRYKVVWSHCKGHVCSYTNFLKCPRFILQNFRKWIKMLLSNKEGVRECPECHLYMRNHYWDKHKCSTKFECELCHTCRYTKKHVNKPVHHCYHRHRYTISSLTIKKAMKIVQKKQDEKRQKELNESFKRNQIRTEKILNILICKHSNCVSNIK